MTAHLKPLLQEDSHKNKLIFGDCLDVLIKLKSESSDGFIDLIYIDPPFNSKRNYNILFEDADLKDAKAQKEAFADTWSNISYKDTLQQLKGIDIDLFRFLESLDSIRIAKSAVAYLTTMAIRIWYMHKVLKKTGSFYLHCDSNMSHYLKLICDLVFGEQNCINEIIWKRTNNPKGSQFEARKFGICTDTILLYAKSDNYYINIDGVRTQLTEEEMVVKYPLKDRNGRFLTYPILRSASKGERPNLVYEYKGFTPPKWGWVVKKEKLIAIDERGDLGWTKNKTPFRKFRPDEDKGQPIYNLWDDILRIQSNSDEDLGYPTQKPIALLERIIAASSREGDLVADFFCGCGTTIAAARHLKRRWLGVDISHLAIGLIERRLIGHYGKKIKETYEVDGFPRDIGAAKQLAAGTEGGRFKFQDWIIEAMLGGIHNPKKTADGGWDGHMTFDIGNRKEIVLIEVKSGNVNVKNLREFIHVTRKEKAGMGLFVCFKEQITKPMLLEAKEQGYYQFETGTGSNHDKIQIISVEDLLEGIMPRIPYTLNQTFKGAQRKLSKGSDQQKFELE